MSFGAKLSIFISFALLLDLIPLELIFHSTRNDLATGQMIGLFVLIALLTCAVAGVAAYRHFRSAAIARAFRWTTSITFFTGSGICLYF